MIEAQVFNPRARNDVVGYVSLRPNNSFGWRASKVFFGTLCIISLTIATAFVAQGYWVILPFSVLEMAALGACLYLIAQRCRQQQVLKFSAEHLIFESGRNQVERTVVWPRFYTRVHVDQPAHPWQSQSITLRHRSERIEVGQFLPQPEKKALVQHIQQLIRDADRALKHPPRPVNEDPASTP